MNECSFCAENPANDKKILHIFAYVGFFVYLCAKIDANDEKIMILYFSGIGNSLAI